MQKFRTIVEAVQINGATFDGPHRSEAHILGVLCDPQQRCAFFKTPQGMQRAEIGDWIVRDIAGRLSTIKNDVYQANHAQEQSW